MEEKNNKYIAKVIMSENGRVKIRCYHNWIQQCSSTGNSVSSGSRHNVSNPEQIAERSIKRTRSRIYELIENNMFDMHSFITLTFKDEISDYYQAHYYLQNFFRRIKYHMKKTGQEFRYICVPEIQEERSKKYGTDVIHYHLLTNLKVGSFFIPKRERKTQYSHTKERWITSYYYDLPFWKYGYSTAEALNKNSSTGGLMYYFSKYMSKSNNLSFFNKRKILHSNNLKSNVVEYISDISELEEIMADYEPFLQNIYSYESQKPYIVSFDDYEYQIR